MTAFCKPQYLVSLRQSSYLVMCVFCTAYKPYVLTVTTELILYWEWNSTCNYCCWVCECARSCVFSFVGGWVNPCFVEEKCRRVLHARMRMQAWLEVLQHVQSWRTRFPVRQMPIKPMLRSKFLIHAHHWINDRSNTLQTDCASLTMLSIHTSEQAVMLVLGTGSVFLRSSIHPMCSCSLPRSLDHARVKAISNKCVHKATCTV